MAAKRNSETLSLFPSENSYQRKTSLRKKRSPSPLPPVETTAERSKSPIQTTVIQVRSESPNGLYHYPAVPKRTSTPLGMAPLPSPGRRPPSPYKSSAPPMAETQPNNGYNARPLSGLHNLASPPVHPPPPRGTSPSPTDSDPSSYIPHSSPATSHSSPGTSPADAVSKPPLPAPSAAPKRNTPRQTRAARVPQPDLPAPPGPPPEGPAPAPITSIFPAYNPTLPLQKQHYAPVYDPTTVFATSPPRDALSRAPYSPDIGRACSPPLLGGFVSHDQNTSLSSAAAGEAKTGGKSPRKEKDDPFSVNASRGVGASGSGKKDPYLEDPRTGPQFPPPPTKEIKVSARARAKQETGGRLSKKKNAETASNASPNANRWGEDNTQAKRGGRDEAEEESGFARFMNVLKALFGMGDGGSGKRRKRNGKPKGMNSSGWL